MKVLVIENSETKTERIVSLINSVNEKAQIDCVTDLVSGVGFLERIKYDLIVFDFMLPQVKDGDERDIGNEVLQSIQHSKVNGQSHAVALTEFPDIKAKLEQKFHSCGVMIIEYDSDENDWQTPLKFFLDRANKNDAQFVIICAVEVEVEAFQYTDAEVGIPKIIGGLDVMPITYKSLNGFIVQLPRMGIVNATAVTALIVDRFRPQIICMSGICAGVEGKTQLGQIIIPNPCWEHQVGKFTPGGFQIEPYQINLNEKLRIKIKNYIKTKLDLTEIYSDIDPEKFEPSEPIIAPLVSGSAVVANKWKLWLIKRQHRKLVGLEMEAYGVLRAVELANPMLPAFAAKSVVDFADKSKNKKCQHEAAKVSARFSLALLENILNYDA